MHIGDYAGQHLGLTGAWGSLDKGDALAACVLDRGSLTVIVDWHSIRFEFAVLCTPIERPLLNGLPHALLELYVGVALLALRNSHVVLDRFDLTLEV